MEAKTPNFDYLSKKFSSTKLLASGRDVGLPKGQVGNSEVGHMNIGCGRIVKQNLLRIDEAIKNNTLSKNILIEKFIGDVLENKGVVHLIGLVSDGGVHSKDKHILELSKILVNRKIKVIIHAFTDGRDTLPKIALKTLAKFNEKLPSGATIGTVMGRFYPMDRDYRWERISVAWKAIALGKAQYNSKCLKNLIQEAYNRGETDEFISPTILENKNNCKYGGINNGDGLVIANFRSDRVRQIIDSLIDKNFNKFNREKTIEFSSFLGMVPYSKKIDMIIPSLFPEKIIKNSLGEVLSSANLKQLRIAETEKYPHVTFFFNGGHEKLFDGEERILIPSPKVKTYDLAPKMGANKITKEIVEKIKNKSFDVIIANFANPDMVGHTGNYQAVLEGIECIDKCIGKIFNQVTKNEGIMILTPDHGNSEMMWDLENNSPHTAHTSNPVPFILVDEKIDFKLRRGNLADIAPTIIDLLNLNKPKDMEGFSLII